MVENVRKVQSSDVTMKLCGTLQEKVSPYSHHLSRISICDEIIGNGS